jgi:regulator of replication initiation timing
MNKVLQLVLKVFGGILTTAGIITLVVKIVVAFENSTVERRQILDKVITVEQKVDGLTGDMTDIKVRQSEMSGDLALISTTNTNLKDYMMKSAASKGDVKELMEVIKIWDGEKKNSGNDMLEIALPPLKPTETQSSYR